MQTEAEPSPVVSDSSIQTDEVVTPVVSVAELAVQTDEPPRPPSPVRASVEVQTEEVTETDASTSIARVTMWGSVDD